MTFETERLILRPWTQDDAEPLYKYASDPLVGPAAGWEPHKDVEDSRRVIRDILSADGTFAVIIKDNGSEPVGSIGYFKTGGADSGEPELGYWIARPFWGKGYIPEAANALLDFLFNTQCAGRVWCAHFEGNERSRGVIARCGFRFEHSRTTSWPARENVLTHFYSLSREEYLKRCPEESV